MKIVVFPTLVIKNTKLEPSLVVHTFSPWERLADLCEFEAILLYIEFPG